MERALLYCTTTMHARDHLASCWTEEGSVWKLTFSMIPDVFQMRTEYRLKEASQKKMVVGDPDDYAFKGYEKMFNVG